MIIYFIYKPPGKDYPSGEALIAGGIKLSAVRDPMGGILGVIGNPHFLAARSAKVSLKEYIGECAVDGLIRGYR